VVPLLTDLLKGLSTHEKEGRLLLRGRLALPTGSHQNLARPQTVFDVLSFLGLANYFWKHLRAPSAITALLTGLLMLDPAGRH
jgi:hypothetical protein